MDADQRTALRVLGKICAISAASYFFFRMLKHGDKPKQAAEKTIDKVVHPIAAVVAIVASPVKQKASHLVKGSPEAKAFMAAMRAKVGKKKDCGAECKKESKEHPKLPKKVIRQIVKDHAAKKKKPFWKW